MLALARVTTKLHLYPATMNGADAQNMLEGQAYVWGRQDALGQCDHVDAFSFGRFRQCQAWLFRTGQAGSLPAVADSFDQWCTSVRQAGRVDMTEAEVALLRIDQPAGPCGSGWCVSSFCDAVHHVDATGYAWRSEYVSD